jgi:hypothetical protein
LDLSENYLTNRIDNEAFEKLLNIRFINLTKNKQPLLSYVNPEFLDTENNTYRWSGRLPSKIDNSYCRDFKEFLKHFTKPSLI